MLVVCVAVPATAGAQPAADSPQAKPRPARAPAPKRPVRKVTIGGYGSIGSTAFTAADTFDAVLGTAKGKTLGGGVSVGLPWGGLFVDVGAWRFSDRGQRVFVSGGQTFGLGIPVRVTVTPLEVTGGWRFRRLAKRVVPYVGGGISSYAYTESSDFSVSGEDVSERFAGFHLLGGAAFKLSKWLGLAGEAVWATVPDALGDGGVSKAFGDSDLGGTSVRLKVTVGR